MRQKGEAMRILLIRHGDPDYGRDSLSEKGQREATLLKERLIRIPIFGFYTSPLGRARDTAVPTLRAFHAEAKVKSWLQEFPVHQWDEEQQRTHVVWDYLPRTREKHPEWKQKDWYRFEPFARTDTALAVHDANDGLDKLLADYGYIRDGDCYRVSGDQHRHTQIALFCHFGVACVLLSHLLNISAQQLLHGLFLAPTSVTTVASEERDGQLALWRCIGVGDASHLLNANEPISYSGFFGEKDPY